jgi:hypothetical protein
MTKVCSSRQQSLQEQRRDLTTSSGRKARTACDELLKTVMGKDEVTRFEMSKLVSVRLT